VYCSTYRDFSAVPVEAGYVDVPEVKDMSFARRLHLLLTQEDGKGSVEWMPHGRAFRIVAPRKLEQEEVLFRYFGHNRYSTFLSQLKNFGLKVIVTGKDRNCYYHEVRTDDRWWMMLCDGYTMVDVGGRLRMRFCGDI
jgi:HSF-type DNA-binding